ncbi:MAG: 3-oxoacyl-ACP synthase [Treponema sp.]|nr:3-oxoacyl-ACP synthase [Treponema sp.]
MSDINLYLSKPGVMSCAGNNIEELWNSVISGNQSGIKRVKACNDEEFFAARIDDSFLKPSSARYDMRVMRIEEAALDQIADEVQAVKKLYGAERIAVCVGSCDNGTEFSIVGHRKYFADGTFPADYDLEIQGADYVSTFVAEKFGLCGPCATFSTACSSSAGAIIKGAELILAGLADAAVVGGIDIASDTTLIGFNSLEAVSSEVTNPFSKNRHGITLGDGAAFFVLSRENDKEPAKNGIGTGAAVSAAADENASFVGGTRESVRLLGWGESADAYHMTSPDPSGAGAEKAIRRAIEKAGVRAEDVGYINMHGTGTKFNDSMEAKAISAVFGEIKVPVSTTKAITGHTLGAAAALEAAICWKALVENNKENKDNNVKLPVQVWDGEQDPEIPVLNIFDKNTTASVNGQMNGAGDVEKAASNLKVCLSNSFAFGGANACLVIGV